MPQCTPTATKPSALYPIFGRQTIQPVIYSAFHILATARPLTTSPVTLRAFFSEDKNGAM